MNSSNTNVNDRCEKAARAIQDRISRQGARGKSARLKEAITAAIVAGDLAHGDQLPPEPRVAELTGISLGTVRTALSQLALEGYVSREHGRGTFVSIGSDYFTERWHFRFVENETWNPVNPTVTLLERRRIRPKPKWDNFFGKNDRYISIKRFGRLPNEECFISELILPHEPFKRLMEVPASDIENKGVRFILADTFETPVVQSKQYVKLAKCTEFLAEAMEIEIGDPLLNVSIIGEGFGEKPVFLLTVWVPNTDYELDLTARRIGI